jgi:DNA-binding GntR family transcriptional regulator
VATLLHEPARVKAMKRNSAANPPTTLRTHVVQRLREDILSGRYKPGDRLNESSIAREFQMSRIPVREALFELREVGLVMSRERRGMFVTSLSENEIKQINAVRIILEAEAFRRAKGRMTPKVAGALKSLVDKMESTACGVSEAAALDLEFHRTIWAAADNEYLTTLLEPLAALSYSHNILERVGATQREWRLNHHRVLLGFVLGEQGKQVETELKQHLRAAYIKDAANSKLADAGVTKNGASPHPQKRVAAKKAKSK